MVTYSCVNKLCVPSPSTCDPAIDVNCYAKADCSRDCCSPDCDLSVNVCAFGHCVPKLFVAAAVGFVLLMAIK